MSHGGEFTALLVELREIKALLERQAAPAALTLTFQDAARTLGLKSARTISRMVARDELTAVKISGSWMVPVSELRRVATPEQERQRRGPKAIETLDAQSEAQRARDMLKRR